MKHLISELGRPLYSALSTKGFREETLIQNETSNRRTKSVGCQIRVSINPLLFKGEKLKKERLAVLDSDSEKSRFRHSPSFMPNRTL